MPDTKGREHQGPERHTWCASKWWSRSYSTLEANEVLAMKTLAKEKKSDLSQSNGTVGPAAQKAEGQVRPVLDEDQAFGCDRDRHREKENKEKRERKRTAESQGQRERVK